MFAVGVDLVGIPRIKDWVNKEEYLNRILTTDEKKFILAKKKPDRYLAAYLAAKEAAMKALGTGWDCGIGWKEIEIIGNQTERPAVKLHATAARILGKRRTFLSMTWAGDLAAAVVLFEDVS